MPKHYTVTTLLDETNEKTTFQLPNGAITAVSLPGFLTEYGTLKTAIQGMTLGTLSDDMWVGDSTDISDALPGNNFAQREMKLFMRFVGTVTGDTFTRTLGTIDLAQVEFVPGSGDVVKLDAPAAMVALVDAIQAIGRMPDDDTETILVQSAKVIGRNS